MSIDLKILARHMYENYLETVFESLNYKIIQHTSRKKQLKFDKFLWCGQKNISSGDLVGKGLNENSSLTKILAIGFDFL